MKKTIVTEIQEKTGLSSDDAKDIAVAQAYGMGAEKFARRTKHRHIGLDFDGTAALDESPKGQFDGSLGEPHPEMVKRVKKALRIGWRVTIFTARVEKLFTEPPNNDGEWTEAMEQERLIEEWTERHYGRRLSVTAVKLRSFSEIWDDKTTRVEKNTGGTLSPGPCWQELDAICEHDINAQTCPSCRSF